MAISEALARALEIFSKIEQLRSKIEQVKKLGDVLKFSTPKDTEVIASMAATGSWIRGLLR